MPTDPGAIQPSSVAPPPSLSHLSSFRAVNGWRGPGAIAIALGHLATRTDFFPLHHPEPVVLLVDFFFVLSGLVIARVYADKLRHPSAIPEYFVRRFGRIWPLQAATLGILICYELFKFALQLSSGRTFTSPPFSPNGLNTLQSIPTNLLLIQSLGLHDRETWNYPSWSLSVEFATYIAFAAFCLLRPRLRFILSSVTIALSMVLLVWVAPNHMRSTYDFGIFRCLAGFLMGTLCYELLARRRFPDWRFPTIVEGATVCLCTWWLISTAGTYAVIMAPLAFGAFIIVFANERGAISRLLLTKPMQILAEWSFAIYMVHALVLTLMLAALHEYARVTGDSPFILMMNPLAGKAGASPTVEVFHAGSIVSKWAMITAYMSGVLLAAYSAYRFAEIPGRVFFRRLAKRTGSLMSFGQSMRDDTQPIKPAP